MGRWRSLRQGLLAGAIAVALLATATPPASGETQEVFEDGIPLADGDNLVVGGRALTLPTIDPVAALITPSGALRRFQTYLGPGQLIEVEPLPDGDYMGLLVYQGEFGLLRINPDLSPDTACGPNGRGPLTMGAANDLVVVAPFAYVGGALGTDKALFRFELDCSPGTDTDGSQFAGDGLLTQDPAGEPATIYDIEVGPGVLVTAGYEGDDGEIDVFELDGDLFTPFNGTGQLTPDSDSATTRFLYVELRSDGDAQFDAGDTLVTGGQEGSGSTIGAVAGDGSVPDGLCMGHVNGFFTFEVSPTTDDFIFSIEITPGGIVFAGAAVRQSNFQPDAYVNAFNLDLCDRSTGTAAQNWVELLPSLADGTSNFIGALEASGENVFAIGGFDNVATMSFDGFKYLLNPDLMGVGGYGLAGFAPIDLTTQPGSGGPVGGTPGGGLPGGGNDLPGDFNLDGRVDAADYVVWRKAPRLTQDGIVVRIQTPSGVREGDESQLYQEWRTNFGRTSSVQRAGATQRARRRPITFARNRSTLRGNESKLVRVRLTKAGRRLVRGYSRKRLRATLRLTVTYRPASGAAPQRRTFTRRVTLRVQRKRR
jgi:hypothetical protein